MTPQASQRTHALLGPLSLAFPVPAGSENLEVNQNSYFQYVAYLCEVAMKKTKKPLRISGPPPAHRMQAMYNEKIAALEKDVNHLRDWW